MNIKNRCTNAQKMKLDNPKTFYAPKLELLDNINKLKDEGDLFVKICVDEKERFWVKVTDVNEETITGVIDNKLVVIGDLKYGDIISFEKNNIYDIDCDILKNKQFKHLLN